MTQDTPSFRPVHMSMHGRLGQGGIQFDRGALQFLHSRERTWHIASNGGLTIASEVMFSGTVGMNERVVDFGVRWSDTTIPSCFRVGKIPTGCMPQSPSRLRRCVRYGASLELSCRKSG
jgi:hypothetical protein